MGRFDNVVILDEPLACPAGHPLSGLQTKSFHDPSMSTYLIRGDLVLRAAGRSWRNDSDEDERSLWRIGRRGDSRDSISARTRLSAARPLRLHPLRSL